MAHFLLLNDPDNKEQRLIRLEHLSAVVVNKADHAGEAKLVRELLDIASGRKIHETIATQGKGVVELLDGMFR